MPQDGYAHGDWYQRSSRQQRQVDDRPEGEILGYYVRGQENGGGVGEPLDLLALRPSGAAVAEHQRAHAGNPAHQHERKYQVGEATDEAAELGTRNPPSVRPEVDLEHHEDREGHRAKPRHGSPAPRRQPSVGEQQRHERDRQAQPWNPGEGAEPRHQRSARQRGAGIGHPRVVGIRPRELLETLGEAYGQEDPAEGVPGTVGGDERPYDGIGYRKDRGGQCVIPEVTAQRPASQAGEEETQQREGGVQRTEGHGDPGGSPGSRPTLVAGPRVGLWVVSGYGHLCALPCDPILHPCRLLRRPTTPCLRTSMRRHCLSRPTWRPRRGRALRLGPSRYASIRTLGELTHSLVARCI